MKMREWISFFRDYVLPPVCPGCGELIPMENPYAPFCRECRGEWEKEKISVCKSCGEAMIDCICLPPLLQERDEVFSLSAVTSYRGGQSTVPVKTILYLKENRDGRVFDFMARELRHGLLREIEAIGYDGDEVILTALPRRRSAVRTHGFDQAEVLARALSRETGYAYRRLLARKGKAREQKLLKAEERLRNTEAAFVLRHDIDLSGKCVVLVDDIVTTGSGILAGAELLSEAGAETVMAAVIARTVKKEQRSDAEREIF